MEMRVRRYFNHPVSGVRRSNAFSSYNPYSSNGAQTVETNMTESHYWLESSGRWNTGGPWRLTRDRTVWEGSLTPVSWYTGGGSHLGTGTIRLEAPTTATPSLPAYTVPSDDQLDAMGTTAIARTEPTSPAFDLSTFMGELMREGLPHLPGQATRDKVKLARASGSEYLNLEFGWAPLVRGIKDFARVVRDSDEILRKYQEGSGKVIQRSYEWPTESASSIVMCNHSMQPPVGFFTGGGEFQYAFQKRWFEVEYIYHVPTGSSANDKFRRFGSNARKLLGADLNPEVLWNLAPWSWAADWFSNAGDVMHNISALGTDGLVIRNGYVMCHTGKVTERWGVFNQTHLQTQTRTVETKLRRKATPYGFGVDFSSLSARQVATLAALGLSRW